MNIRKVRRLIRERHERQVARAREKMKELIRKTHSQKATEQIMKWYGVDQE